MLFGNRLLRKACGPKNGKVKRNWRNLDDEVFHVSCSSSGDQIKGNDVGGECDTCGGEGKYIQYTGGKHEGKRPLEKPKPRCTYSTMLYDEFYIYIYFTYVMYGNLRTLSLRALGFGFKLNDLYNLRSLDRTQVE
jgi:hypothetical protein